MYPCTGSVRSARPSFFVVSLAAAFAIVGASHRGARAADDAAPALLPVGSVAPDFTALAHDGRTITLSKLKGKQVVLYFYPKDDTPGCTVEACEMRDNWAALGKAGVVVFGVSTQDNVSHKAFAEKHKLPFALLPDEKGDLAARYKVPVVGGKARRITYLIGKDGRIKHVWPKVNPAGHAADILAQAAAG